MNFEKRVVIGTPVKGTPLNCQRDSVELELELLEDVELPELLLVDVELLLLVEVEFLEGVGLTVSNTNGFSSFSNKYL